MDPSILGKIIDQQKWLEPADKTMSAVAEATLKPAGQATRNFLHGTWFGHPLHPALIDIPLGAWSVTTFLDIYELSSGDDSFARGADAALRIGLVASLGAAASGLNDWQYTNRPARRVGVVHALLNIGAMVLFFTSWLQRKRGARESGIGTGILAWIVSMTAAYVGGYLVYDQRVGVDHAQRDGPEKWTPVMTEDDLVENTLHRVSADGVDILLVKKDGRIFAIGEKCAHLSGPLSEGKLEGNTVVCPWHGSQFSLADGNVINGPAVFRQPCFDARVHDGKIEVCTRNALVS
jgi:nitrite reductase/ring-hydroxylating ferredoxin subunit/uncharacterized membrane protein